MSSPVHFYRKYTGRVQLPISTTRINMRYKEYFLNGIDGKKSFENGIVQTILETTCRYDFFHYWVKVNKTLNLKT